MDALLKLPREVLVVLGGAVLYVLLSFFDWQSHSFGAAGGWGQSLWQGFGVVAALIGVALLGWEIARAMNVTVEYDSVNSATVSAALAFGLAFFTLIVFLDWSEYRTWAAWLGTLDVLAIAGAAFVRARSEEVKLPAMPVELPFELPLKSRPLAVPATPAAAPAPEPEGEPDLLEDIAPTLRSYAEA